MPKTYRATRVTVISRTCADGVVIPIVVAEFEELSSEGVFKVIASGEMHLEFKGGDVEFRSSFKRKRPDEFSVQDVITRYRHSVRVDDM